jgi:hypothetical protein
MDISTIIKSIAAIATLVGAGKAYYDLIAGKSVRLRDDYRFSREFLNDIQKGDLHPYSIEKGYQALANSTVVSTSEIEYILTLENPVKCLRDYVLAHHYLEKISVDGNHKISFKQKYVSKWPRLWRKILHIVLYGAFAFLAFTPLIFGKMLDLQLSQIVIAQCIAFPCFGMYAWFSLKSFARIFRGENIVFNQSKQTHKIIVKT